MEKGKKKTGLIVGLIVFGVLALGSIGITAISDDSKTTETVSAKPEEKKIEPPKQEMPKEEVKYEIIKIDDSFVKEINSDSSFYFKMFHAYGIYSTFLDKPFSLEISFNKKAQKINKPKQPRAEIYYEQVNDIDE